MRKYENGTETYCCLGVACVVARENGLELNTHVDTDGDVLFGLGRIGTLTWQEDADYAHLPKSVMDWYSFGDPSPDVKDENDEWDAATGLNDDMHYDFARIADAFERTFLREETAG